MAYGRSGIEDLKEGAERLSMAGRLAGRHAGRQAGRRGEKDMRARHIESEKK